MRSAWRPRSRAIGCFTAQLPARSPEWSASSQHCSRRSCLRGVCLASWLHSISAAGRCRRRRRRRRFKFVLLSALAPLARLVLAQDADGSDAAGQSHGPRYQQLTSATEVQPQAAAVAPASRYAAGEATGPSARRQPHVRRTFAISSCSLRPQSIPFCPSSSSVCSTTGTTYCRCCARARVGVQQTHTHKLSVGITRAQSPTWASRKWFRPPSTRRRGP